MYKKPISKFIVAILIYLLTISPSLTVLGSKSMANQWIKDTKTGAIYRTDKYGHKITGSQWLTINNVKYRINDKGFLYTNTWLRFPSGNTYRVNDKGAVLTNCWITIKGLKYRANSKGILYKNKTFTVNKKKYNANTYGVVSVKLNVPMVSQFPELISGCEIASIAQMLLYAGAKVDKIKLAKEIPYHKKDPNKGYVGSPFLFSGYTIFPKALVKTVKKYVGSAKDMTGYSLKSLELQLSKGKPIAAWVGDFDEWFLHCIVLTGYDSNYYYYNDCSKEQKNLKISKTTFKKKWALYGNKALSY